jgi:integrase/recombinase XerD
MSLKERKLAPTSIIRKVASLRGFFKWTSSMNILEKNPASTLEQPKVPQRLPKVISIKEIEELLQSEMNELQLVMIELLYSCGLRVSELVNLKINDIDLNSKYVRCFGKGSKERIIPVGVKAVKAIKTYMPVRDWTLKKYNLNIYGYQPTSGSTNPPNPPKSGSNIVKSCNSCHKDAKASGNKNCNCKE